MPVQISVISPVYEAAAIIPRLTEEITRNLSPLTDDFEIVLVEDGSRDDSWEAIRMACKRDSRIRGIQLSRNFGQHLAITAGLAEASGEWIVVMDCDLQDRPDQIPLLYNTALQGYDTVCAQRIHRNDPPLKKLASKLFYQVFSYLTGTEQDSSISNFGIYHRKVITSILSMQDANRYFPAMVQWVGYRRAKVPVLHATRFEGKTTYSLGKLMRLATNNILSFSDKPLSLIVFAGIAITGLSALTGSALLAGALLGWIRVPGYTSILVSIWLTAGLMIFMLGVVGLYVGKTHERAKMRPYYLVGERVN